MGVDAFFSTNKEINAGGTKYADFMKDWIVKAMQATTQIPGGNSSTHPINGGPNNPGIKPPNVTVWSVPAQMKAVMYELRPNQPADVQGNNAISVSISCPKPKETANLCAVAGSLIALAAAVLGVFTEGITTSLLGAVGATAGAGGAGCGAATS
ncbi:hypothetical protein FA10DRAFT_288327 [Acaromyces ingoldii]|uniref:Uncharacterized protein n=1 Tax=Acaromyces ingoldii TaxID=215250 RepID=A0A316YIA7_9BASI|nr:hypothetical protein FA10DRAFT_288327 [Acaromyces ingoldii]PWN88806.1 hypothetical protein FA10DRAFT_288327 [Acaromyces ingoldii]